VKKLLVSLLVIILLSPFMQYIDKQKPRMESEGRVLSYSYTRLRLTFPSLKESVADVLYMKTCILVGGNGESKLRSDDWGRVLDNVKVMNRLDRYYFDPYYFVGSYVPWNLTNYPEKIELVNSILKEGMKYVKDWRIPFFIGFNYFYFLKQKRKGAEYLKVAASMKGSPQYLRLLVSRLYLETGEIDLAISVTREEIKGAKNKRLKEKLRKRLAALTIIKELDLAVREFKRFKNRCPETVEELKRFHFINYIPEDPYGGKFYIKDDCTVWTTSNLRERD